MKPSIFLSALLLSLSSGLFAQTEIIDKIIAAVGGELVLLSELEEQYSLISAQQGGLPPEAKCFILDNIMGQKLLVNQAKLDSVLITDEEVEGQLDARIEQILAYMNNDYRQFEEYYGQTVNQVKDQFRVDLRDQLLAERMQGTVMSSITVTPSEVKTFFESIPKDSLPYFDSEVEVRELVYEPKINEEEQQKALDKIQSLRKRIVDDKEDFAKLAERFSDDFGSARIGGDLGWARRGKFVAEFEAAAYNLEIGEISDVVESPFGYHIIQLLERRGNSIHTRHILVTPEITPTDIKLARAFLDSLRNQIVADSLPFSLALKRHGYKDVQSFHNDGRMVNPATGNTFFEIKDLDPDIYFAIDTLKVGQITKAFPFKSIKGETLFRIVELQSQTPPHKASLELDYSKIQAAAVEEKKSRFINDWIIQRIDATYINIDPRFDECPVLDKWRGEVVRTP
jgi:peptidyl-prolyl cis-trans isomerase SurA